jgi:integrase/recombinase XerC
VPKIDPDSGEAYGLKLAAHSFHDLRHTFACWLYHAERKSGNSEPWKVVQARLGHKYLSTTMDTYLRVVDEYRFEVNSNVYKFLRRLASGS